MADHSKPTTTSTYVNFVSELDGRLDDISLGLDPATTSPTNLATNAIRWTSASNKWQKYNGTTWNDLSSAYSININGTVGATTPASGAFTTLSATGNVTLGDASGDTVTINGTVDAGVVISGSTATDALRITQTGAGNALVVEDSTNPDSTPFVVDASGNVGMGTTAPAYLLQVGSSTNRGIAALIGTSTSSTYLKLDATALTSGRAYGLFSGSSANGNFDIYDFNASAYRLTIDSSGNVGIGTSSPNTQLSINGAMNFTNTVSAPAVAAAIYSPSSAQMGFVTNSSERMRIDGSGKVGIGTTNSLRNLSVSGASGFGVGYAWGTSGSALFVDVDPTPANGITLTSEFWGTGSYGPMMFKTGNAERMRIDTSGNVGIGTTSPSYKLDVSGSGRVTGDFYVGTSNNIIYQTGVSNDFIVRSGNALAFYTNGANERARIDSSGNVLVKSVAGLGYGTGAGGTVTQATSKSTAVTLNKPNGRITMNGAALAANTTVEFTFNNSLISGGDMVVINITGNAAIAAAYNIGTRGLAGGSIVVGVRNITAGSLSESLELTFALIKGATA